MKKILPALGVLAILAACSSVPLEEPSAPGAQPTPRDIALRPLVVPALSALPDTPARALQGRFAAADWGSLPGWRDDALQHVWKGFVNNCKGLMRPVAGSLAQPARATPRAWQPVCAAASAAGLAPESGGEAVRAFLQAHLRPWRLLDASGHAANGTVTGYYEPLIRASRQRQGAYQWPLYATPDDLLTVDLGAVYPELAGKRIRGKLVGQRVVPYDTRAQIAADPARQPPAIVWADDPVEAFFLQIQGSGRASLPDGTVIRLAYANHNGRPYVSIGQWLARQGEMPLAQTSMQNIKRWAQEHPERVQQMLNVNPAMVFFQEEPVTDPELGPKGAYGIPLLAQRAIAVDTTFVPLGAPVYLATQRPGGAGPLRRLVFAQDTGAAIRGAGRADFYWGFGDEAGQEAGRMKQPGQMWVLWPAQAGAPSAR
ncbi:MAG TPA: murein transglycosylase A [Castellaniella sp.]|nr:murein transglycosylase A [Castellaniella sp.]